MIRITWFVLLCKLVYRELQEIFQSVVIKANTLFTVVLSVNFRWKGWVMFTVISNMR